MVSILFRDPAATGLIPAFFFSEENIADVAEVNQQQCLEESGQWLENVDRTHLALVNGKRVLQKTKITLPLGPFYGTSPGQRG